MNLLLDTTVMIDVIRFRNQRNQFLAELVRSGHRLCTSTLNIAELYAGIRPGESARNRLQQHATAAGPEFLQPGGKPVKIVPAQIELVELAQGAQNLRDSRESVSTQIEVPQLPKLLEGIGQRDEAIVAQRQFLECREACEEAGQGFQADIFQPQLF